MTPDIELSQEEKNLVDKIIFEPLQLKDSDTARNNGEAVLRLIQLLSSRHGIPKVRIKYFTDPEFNLGGRGKSKQEIFEKNGNLGDDIFRHPQFLYFLSYFIFGPDLPPKLKDEFVAEVKGCGPITSGDVLPLAKWAKQATTRYGLEPDKAAEEFFKLSIECGINSSYAATISHKVKTA